MHDATIYNKPFHAILQTPLLLLLRYTCLFNLRLSNSVTDLADAVQEGEGDDEGGESETCAPIECSAQTALSSVWRGPLVGIVHASLGLDLALRHPSLNDRVDGKPKRGSNHGHAVEQSSGERLLPRSGQFGDVEDAGAEDEVGAEDGSEELAGRSEMEGGGVRGREEV